MTTFAILVFVISCGALLLWGLRSRERLYQFPCLAGAVFAGWALPQLFGLIDDPFLPENAVAKLAFFSALCALSCLAGYLWSSRPLVRANWTFDSRHLAHVSVALSAIGGFFYVLVGRMADEATETYFGQWSGTITVYFFFSRLLTYGLLIAAVSFIRSPSKFWLSIVLIDSLFYFHRIVFYGRRAETIELALIGLLILWFYRRAVIPRWAFVVAFSGATLAVHSIGDYRSQLAEQLAAPASGLLEIDWIGNFQDVLARGGLEMTNAAYYIEAVDRSKQFDFGVSLWNALVFQYVPAQYVGAELKSMMMIELTDLAYKEFGYVPHTGTTLTGMTDSFSSFWYFGAVKFFMIAWILRRLYEAANRGHVVAQLLLFVLITPSLHAITHTTNWFFKDLPQVLLFLLLPLYYARVSSQRQSRDVGTFVRSTTGRPPR